MYLNPILCVVFFTYLNNILDVSADSRWAQGSKPTQKLIGNGFHRAIQYKWMPNWANGDPVESDKFMVKQEIPAFMYIDMDEVRNLMDDGGARVLVKYDFDTEKPSYDSDSQIVTVYPSKETLNSKISSVGISVPVHLRYQMPTENGGQVTLSLQPGSLYQRIAEKEPESKIIKDQCNDTSEAYCLWKLLDEFSTVDDGLRFSLPTGTLGSAKIVVITTVLVSSIAAFLIVFRTTR